MRLAVLPLAILLATTACGTSTALDEGLSLRPGDAQDVPLRALPGGEQFAYYSGIAEPRRAVIRDAETWAATWHELTDGRTPAPPLPAVDFSHDAILLATMGSRPSGGHAIAVESAYASGERLYVDVRETSPGARCAVIAAITTPVGLALVPRSYGEPVWVERRTERSCD